MSFETDPEQPDGLVVLDELGRSAVLRLDDVARPAALQLVIVDSGAVTRFDLPPLEAVRSAAGELRIGTRRFAVSDEQVARLFVDSIHEVSRGIEQRRDGDGEVSGAGGAGTGAGPDLLGAAADGSSTRIGGGLAALAPPPPPRYAILAGFVEVLAWGLMLFGAFASAMAAFQVNPGCGRSCSFEERYPLAWAGLGTIALILLVGLAVALLASYLVARAADPRCCPDVGCQHERAHRDAS